jgi:hypothetical protein
MKVKFAHRLRALSVLVVIAFVLVACGGTSTSPSTSSSGGALAPNASFKLGVSLTFNNTDFWTNYISYETKFATQYNATLIGPLVASNNAAQQITDIHTLIQEGAQALIVNPVDSAANRTRARFCSQQEHSRRHRGCCAKHRQSVYDRARGQCSVWPELLSVYRETRHEHHRPRRCSRRGSGLTKRSGPLKRLYPVSQDKLSKPQARRVRDEMGYSDCCQRRQDCAEHLPRPARHLCSVERPRGWHSRR